MFVKGLIVGLAVSLIVMAVFAAVHGSRAIRRSREARRRFIKD